MCVFVHARERGGGGRERCVPCMHIMHTCLYSTLPRTIYPEKLQTRKLVPMQYVQRRDEYPEGEAQPV